MLRKGTFLLFMNYFYIYIYIISYCIYATHNSERANLFKIKNYPEKCFKNWPIYRKRKPRYFILVFNFKQFHTAEILKSIFRNSTLIYKRVNYRQLFMIS